MTPPRETPYVDGLPIPTWDDHFQQAMPSGDWRFLGLAITGGGSMISELIPIDGCGFLRKTIAAVAEVAWRKRAREAPVGDKVACHRAVRSCREWGERS